MVINFISLNSRYLSHVLTNLGMKNNVFQCPPELKNALQLGLECVSLHQNLTGLVHMMSFTQTCAVFEKLVVSDLSCLSYDRF
jgi:hypothetical protein